MTNAIGKHTRGPWVFRKAKGIFLAGLFCNGKHLAWFKTPISEADGVLISAAPDLLESLEACSAELRLMIDRHNVINPDDGSRPYDYQTVFEAGLVIARAKGESK